MKAGSCEMTSTLMEHNAWVDQVCCRKRTAMHEAAAAGDVDVLMLLLRNGGRVNQRDESGRTPLALAAEHGHFHVAEILLNCGQSEGSKRSAGAREEQCNPDTWCPLSPPQVAQ